MKRAAAVLAVLLFLGTVWTVFPVWGAEGTEKNEEIQRVEEIADRIIQWKKENEGNEKEGFFSDSFLCSAGTTLADWYVLGLSRSGAEEDYASYRFALAQTVEERYKTSGGLDPSKATEWHRIILSTLASGGNPKKAGIRGQIDLVADGVYNRADNEGNGILGKQGINGYIWGLIALDSCFYAVPEEAFYTREELLLNILNRQNADGGWSLSGDRSDVDMTAMALQALAPYKNSEQVYSYQNKKLYPDGKTVEKKVYTCIEEALRFLSEEQQEDGGYASEGIPNSESTAQVLLALCALGMDPLKEKDFIKNGNTVLEGILKYRNADGGFLHSLVDSSENQASLAARSDGMAGAQALNGLTALLRLWRNQRRLCDFRPEQSLQLREQIAAAEEKIALLTAESSFEEIQKAYAQYLEIDSGERSYISNYRTLSELLVLAGIPYAGEQMEYNTGAGEGLGYSEDFTESDRECADGLPERVTLAQRTTIQRLFYKVQNCPDFEGKEAYKALLEEKMGQIEEREREVDALNAGIAEKLYPLDSLTLGDLKTVEELMARYEALCAEERAFVKNSGDLERAVTRLTGLRRSVFIGIGAGAGVLLLGILAFWGIRRRLTGKKREMEQLSALFREEEEK